MGTRQKIASEKTAELLFTRYFLQALGLRTAVVIAPTTRQESLDGYDAKITSSFCELVLQFKSPTLIRRAHRQTAFSIRLDSRQHQRLRIDPPKSAFYVSHAFRTRDEFEAAQLGVRDAAEFLKHFIVVSPEGLRYSPAAVEYYTPLRGRFEEPHYRSSLDQRKVAGHSVAPGNFMGGQALLKQFKLGMIGTPRNIRMAEGPHNSERTLDPWSVIAHRLRGSDDLREEQNYGVIIRRAEIAGGAARR